MAALLLDGPRTWSMSRDEMGHRDYKIKFLVECGRDDGPAIALQCPGLPLPYSYWNFDNDVDLWALCKYDATVTPLVSKEPNNYFEIEFTFTTKPVQVCRQAQVEDPLLEPDRVSGGFNRYSEEAATDRYGTMITNSAWQQIRGPQVEFDASRAHVTIEQTVAVLELELIYSMRDTLNDDDLWGFPARSIKLSNVTWKRLYTGSCDVYYTRSFEFEVRAGTTSWDRDVPDEGSMVLRGKWGDADNPGWILRQVEGEDPDPNDPTHFIQYQDRDGKHNRILLNGAGLPANAVVKRDGYFVSIVGANLGNPLSDSDNWLPLRNRISDGTTNPTPAGNPIIEEWVGGSGVGGTPGADPGPQYNAGTIVKQTFPTSVSYFIAVERNQGDDPSNGSGAWVLISSPDPPFYDGTYADNQTFDKGAYVRQTVENTSAGTIHIEKYEESNFLLLNLPLSF